MNEYYPQHENYPGEPEEVKYGPKSEVDCKKRTVIIGGGNYYIFYDETFISVAIPRENDKQNLRERLALDKYCEELSQSEIFGELAFDMLVERIHEVRR